MLYAAVRQFHGKYWLRCWPESKERFSDLFLSSGKTGQELRENEWLMGIKQRSAIPGGVCEFDLPSYHFWLNQSAEVRRLDLNEWLAPVSANSQWRADHS